MSEKVIDPEIVFEEDEQPQVLKKASQIVEKAKLVVGCAALALLIAGAIYKEIKKV